MTFSDKMNCVSELGIDVKINKKVIDAVGKKSITKKLELGTSRALALCSLSVLSKETKWKITALDAVQDFALAGSQWVKYIKNNVKVTINTADDPDLVKSMLLNNNCDVNDENVQIISEDPLAHMHCNRYTFIYVEISGCAVTYLDCVMRSIKHNGLICISSTDMAVLQNKSPAAAYRLYGAKLWKTEYYRELGCRVVIASVVRAAARWSKGVEVLLCVAENDGVFIVFRVSRGARFGEASMSMLKYLSHCQVCQARSFISNDYNLMNYSTLPSMCQCPRNGAPVLLLGPMWCSEIYNKPFLFKLLREAKDFELNKQHLQRIEMLIIENTCPSSNESEDDLRREIKEVVDDKNESTEPESKRLKLDAALSTNDCSNGENKYLKIDPPDFDPDDLLKSTAFYFDFQHHSVKRGNPPTICSVITKLRSDGYRASRTHFGPRCVRTSASLSVFKEVLQFIWDNTKK